MNRTPQFFLPSPLSGRKRPLLAALVLLGVGLGSSALATAPVPGQSQPLAPGTRPAPVMPTLTLTPAVPQVFKIEYLSNGYIEVAHAILTLTPAERPQARLLASTVARRVLAARPSLDEVNISVYDKATYAGFGGPLPLLTASVPRDRLNDFTAWAGSLGLGNTSGGVGSAPEPRATYDRVWVNPGNLSVTRAPEHVRETGPTLRPSSGSGDVAGVSAAAQNRIALQQTTARVAGGLYEGLLFRGKRDGGSVAALTFDDAPHPMFAPLLLDLLRRSGARATFFVIGRNAEAYPYFVRDMAAQGHEVGNHTYHHVRLPPLPLNEAVAEMRQASEVITALTGKPVRYFRPPGGEYTLDTLAAARRLGLTTVFWTDDPGDFLNPGDALLESRLRQRLRPGGIVLLHDNAPQMLDVLQGFLRVARQEGVTLTTVGGLPK